jgi:hypothetical protein
VLLSGGDELSVDFSSAALPTAAKHGSHLSVSAGWDKEDNATRCREPRWAIAGRRRACVEPADDGTASAIQYSLGGRHHFARRGREVDHDKHP